MSEVVGVSIHTTVVAIQAATVIGVSTHPGQYELDRRYREARRGWASDVCVRTAAETFGMDERAYCDLYVAEYGPICWTGTVIATDTPLNYDRAFRSGRVRE